MHPLEVLRAWRKAHPLPARPPVVRSVASPASTASPATMPGVALHPVVPVPTHTG